MISEVFYSQYFCNLQLNRSHSSYTLLLGSRLISSEIKTFEVRTEYDSILKILSKMLGKITTMYGEDFGGSQLVVEIPNKQLRDDLLSPNTIEGLDNSINGLYVPLYEKINEGKIKIVADLTEYLKYKSSSSDNYSIIENLEFYQSLNRLDVTIRKSRGVIQERNRMLSNKEMAIQDILHFVELMDLTETKKIEFIDTLKKIRTERREIKDDLQIARLFSRTLCKLSNKIQAMGECTESYDGINLLQEYKAIFATKTAREELIKSI